MRRASKVDQSQPEIVQALREHGATVQLCHQVAGGFPDLVVGYRGRVIFIECKVPGGKLTPDQVIWHEQWAGTPIHIAHSGTEAVSILKEIDANSKRD